MKYKAPFMFLGVVLVLSLAVGIGTGCSNHQSSNFPFPTSTYNYPTATQSGYCASGCLWTMVGNGVCNSACNVASCNYDSGDCSAPTATQSSYCASGCPWAWVGDGYCDSTCYTSSCNWDGGDCSPTPTYTYTSPSCPCDGMSNEWDAEECVWSYLFTDIDTTYNGQQILAALADAFDYAYHGDCYQYSDGSWEVNTYFDTWAIEDQALLDDIFTQTSLCGPSNREAYNTRWRISSAGCIQGTDGNAMRLLAELEN